MSETDLSADVVATRETEGGIAGATERLTVHADGTLRLVNQRFNRDETRKVPPTQLEPLRAALASEEWQSIEGFFGIPVPDGFLIRVIAAGREAGFAEPSQQPVELPPILGRVLTLLQELWASTPGDDDPAPAQFPEPDVFELEGEGIRVTYQAAPEARSLHYRDEHHDRRFSGDELATVKIAAGTVVSAIIEQASHGDYTLDVIIPHLYLDGHDRPSDVEVPAIQTTVIGGFVPNIPPFRTGQQQKYNVVLLRGSARKATTAP